MCGIIGYVGKKNSVPFIIDGLKKLEYRGYDSAGISILQEGKIVTVRAVHLATWPSATLAAAGEEIVIVSAPAANMSAMS